jgi:hypothetical protein
MFDEVDIEIGDWCEVDGDEEGGQCSEEVEESFKKRETAEVMVYVVNSGGRGMVVVVRCLYMPAAVRIISGKGLQI